MAEAWSSEEVIDYPCSPCQKRYKGVEAHVGCQICQQYLCSTCRVYHDTLHPDHKVLTRADFRQLCFVKLTERCPRHVEKVIEMYCPTHDEVTCSVCIALNHRSCAPAKYIPTDIKHLTPSELQKITIQEESLRIAREVLRQHLEKLKLARVRETTTIQETHRRLVTTLEGLVKNAVKEVEAKSQEISRKILAQLSETDRILADIQQKIRQMRSTGLEEAQIFVAMKQYKLKIAEADELNDNIMNSSVQHDLVFSIDSRLEKCLAEMKALGTVDTKHQHFYQKTKTLIKRIVEKGDFMSCNITSCCVMQDGSIVLADNGNKKLKHLHSANMSIQSSHFLEEGPRSVCSVIHKEVVVCSDRKSVHIFEVADGFIPKGSINLDHGCRSIAYSYGEMYISDGGEHVHVYNSNANFVRSLGPTSAKTKLDGAEQITFNENGTKLLVVVRGMLICMDRLGKELFLCQGRDSTSPSAAVCSDGAQGFFVTAPRSPSIIQLVAKGDMIGKILKESDNRATQAICFNPATKKLIVGYASNTIHVYELVQNHDTVIKKSGV